MRAMRETESFYLRTALWCSETSSMQKNKTPIHLPMVSPAPESLVGVGDIVKMESSHPIMIYMPIVCFVFPTNISDLLGLSQDKLEFCVSSVLSEWVKVTLKTVLKSPRVTLWSSWACDWEPTSYNDLCHKLKAVGNGFDLFKSVERV